MGCEEVKIGPQVVDENKRRFILGLYDAVTETEEYADITREEVMEYYQKCP